MIKRDTDTTAWTLFMDQLIEAHDHLGDLIEKLAIDHDYDESSFRVDMEHVAAHLNRAWASRNIPRDITEEEWARFRDHRSDLPSSTNGRSNGS
jgi:hypothetical protein